MPPKKKMSAKQVENALKKRIIKPCEPKSHFVDVFGNCGCGENWFEKKMLK